MKLVRAILRNFRGHVSTDVTFPDGITLVVGANGSGKTSLFEGVLWALYGSYEVRTTMDSVRYWYAEKGDPCSAEVWLRSGDNEWVVKRSLSDATVTLNGSEQANGQGGVSEYVENLLGMDRKEFRETYFTEQKALEVLKDRGPTDRARFYNRIMRYDEVREAESAAREKKNKAKHRVDILSARLDALPDVTPEDARTAADAYADARDRVGLAELSVESAKEKLGAAKSRRDKLTDARDKVETLRENLSKASQKATVARERLSTGRDALEESEAAQRALETLERRVEEIAPKAEAHESQISALKDEAASIEGEVRALRGRRERITEQAKSVREIGPEGECWTCGRDFDPDSFGGAVGHLTDEADSIGARIGQLGDDLNRIRQEVKSLVERDDNPVKELNQRKAEADGHRTLASKLDAIRERIAKRKKELREAEARHDEILAQLNAVEYDEEGWRKANAAVEAASDNLSDARVALSDAKAKAFTARKAKEDAKEAVARRTKSEEELEAASARFSILSDVDRFLSDLRGYLNDRLRPELSELASDALVSMTGGTFTALELDEDFALRLYMGGVEVDGESGGEEDVAALAMRLATSQLVSERHGEGFSTLKLDEVFAHVDSRERIPLVMAELRRLVDSGRFRQIILIEHREEVEEYVDHVVKVERDNRTKRSHVNMVYGDNDEGHNLDLPASFDTAAD